MSMIKSKELVEIAKKICREHRKNQTVTEKIFWEKVRNRRLLNRKFYRQHPIFLDLIDKETFYIADFYCYECKLVVEINGKYHDYQKEQDKLRDYLMNLLGLTVLRFKNEDIKENIKEVLEEVIKYLK